MAHRNRKPARSPAAAASPRGNAPQTVPVQWLLTALSLVVPLAALCAWGALCLLFWQGGWQLLYRPSAAVTRTPSDAGLAYTPVTFATTEAGQPRLSGWWIPAATEARFTALYLHDRTGNLGDTLDDLKRLHEAGLNVLAFDYRGYGASRFVHPSEAHWREDAEWALGYLSQTRHIDPRVTVLVGRGLGANLAIEIAAEHASLAGVVLEQPINAPADAIFRDPRAALVPAHWLVRDRWNLAGPAATLRIPSMWFTQRTEASATNAAFQAVSAPKTRVWINGTGPSPQEFATALSRWLGDIGALPSARH